MARHDVEVQLCSVMPQLNCAAGLNLDPHKVAADEPAG